MKKRLSSSQIWVIELMQKGWQLYRTSPNMTSGRALPHRYGLQDGGFGFGGKTHKVNNKTVDALVKMNIIQVDTEFPKYTFKLIMKL